MDVKILVSIAFSCFFLNCEGVPVKDSQIIKHDPESEGVMCSTCTLVVTLMKVRLSNNTTQGLVKKLLTKDCMELTANKTNVCSVVVPLAMEALRSSLNLSSTQICKVLGLCQPTGKVSRPDEKQNTGAVGMNQKTNGLMCGACKLVVQQADDYLLTKVPGVSDYIKTVCKNLPHPADQECLDWLKSLDLNRTLPMVIKTVLKPQDVCEVVGLCSPTLPIDSSSTRFIFKSALGHELFPTDHILQSPVELTSGKTDELTKQKEPSN